MEFDALNELSWGSSEGKPPTDEIRELWKEWDNGNYDGNNSIALRILHNHGHVLYLRVILCIFNIFHLLAAAEGGESPNTAERRAVPILYNLIRNSHLDQTHFVFIIHGRLIR